jgi:hypothetical protein
MASYTTTKLIARRGEDKILRYWASIERLDEFKGIIFEEYMGTDEPTVERTKHAIDKIEKLMNEKIDVKEDPNAQATP